MQLRTRPVRHTSDKPKEGAEFFSLEKVRHPSILQLFLRIEHRLERNAGQLPGADLAAYDLVGVDGAVHEHQQVTAAMDTEAKRRTSLSGGCNE